MSNPILPQIDCQRCAQMGRKSFYQEVENGRYADPQGLLAAQVMCFQCGTRPQGGVRLEVQEPPCRRCQYSHRGFVRAGAELNAANSSLDFLNTMRSNHAIPDSRTFYDQTKGNSVPGGGM